MEIKLVFSAIFHKCVEFAKKQKQTILFTRQTSRNKKVLSIRGLLNVVPFFLFSYFPHTIFSI